MSKEVEYRDVPGFPGYRVGDDGSVWSCRTTASKLSDEWHRLTSQEDKDGYLYVSLSLDRKKILKKIHQLVLLAFIGPCPNGCEAAHENGVNIDNRPDNLAWKTHKQNISDKRRHGTQQEGASHHRAKLTEEIVLEIRSGGKQRGRLSRIARELGLNKSTVCDAFNRKTWIHI